MRLTIVPSDNAVYVDQVYYGDLDFSSCEIPVNIHALQWYDTIGEIEFTSEPMQIKPVNEQITELPAWALACKAKWDEAKAAADAAQKT